MTHREIRTIRYDAHTAARWPGRSYALGPAEWSSAARWLADGGPVELRVHPSALDGLRTDAMVAASALRDAGIGLALSFAGRPEHLRWLRILPWSAVIAHPALVDDTCGADRARVAESWAEAAHRHGLDYVAPVRDVALLASLPGAGFTHGELAADRC